MPTELTPNPGSNVPGTNEPISTDETSNLIAADKVEGTAVYNREGDQIGTIRTIMLNKFNGRVAYAVMSFGGFLGIGEDYRPVPWEALTYDTRLGGYVVNIDPDQLDNAPRYPAGEEPNWTDKVYNDELYRYYGIPYPTF
ncbi:PRC-barrel domain-containing protein [Faunimonas pinastri]|uniref:PRC-barrel domain-containing protein n=1 Tax=Faunimonas pinastri TaxID=1855383 RepID=A0A1H9JHJ2_9HYPH|nr:PRC-barrel domain-containing protein [Faunimonas pinastri]SEQ86312.1 PRC-barrel domain-containing protein [Faunimonas pinastri]